jgi:energy-coupling factor transporter ATP-binding protein EcfA2
MPEMLPSIIILDEPTSSLDPKAESEVSSRSKQPNTDRYVWLDDHRKARAL